MTMDRECESDQPDATGTEPTAQARAHAARADAGRELLAGALGDDREFAAALTAFAQVGSQIDVCQDTDLRLPDDAGEYAPGLRRILMRIPDGWGRWISCDRGWYPLLVELDEQISRLDPLYEIHQVKEKFGGLRYYYAASDPFVYYQHLHPESSDGWEGYQEFSSSEAGQRLVQELQARSQQIEALVEHAARKAQRTCERCAGDGETRRTLSPAPWYKTLCAECAGDGYADERTWDAWWADEKPRFEGRERERCRELHDDWIATNTGKRIVQAGSTRRLAVPAIIPADPGSARQAAFEDWDLIFIGADELGDAFVDGLAERYRPQLEANARAKLEFKQPEGNPFVIFLPDRPYDLREVTVIGNVNDLGNRGVLFDLGLDVMCTVDYQFADFAVD